MALHTYKIWICIVGVRFLCVLDKDRSIRCVLITFCHGFLLPPPYDILYTKKIMLKKNRDHYRNFLPLQKSFEVTKGPLKGNNYLLSQP